jgi:hypothetical protein
VLDDKMVPIRGHDERAFPGLLQRRYRHDAEAQELANPDYSHPCTQLRFEYICSDAIMTGPGGARTGLYPCCEVQQVFLSP